MSRYAGNNLVTHRALKGPRMIYRLHSDAEKQHECRLTLQAIQETRHKIDRSELIAVRLGREGGMSWTDIATALGMSRQSAWERWHDDIDGALDRAGSAID